MNKQALLRRAAVTAAASGLFLSGLATAQSASAAETFGGSLTSGTAKTATISTADDTASYTLPVEKGQHLTISTSASTWSNNGSAQLKLYVPNQTGTAWVYFKEWTAANGQTPFLDVTPEANGIWKLVVDPTGTATGSTTFTYALDAAPKLPNNSSTYILEHGVSHKFANTVPGQNATGYFHVEKGAHVTLDITASAWNGTTYGHIYTPSGTLAKIVGLGSTPTFHDWTVEETGYWRFVADPQGNATGSASATVVTDLNKGQLATNVPATAKITNKGQDAWFGLYGVAGDDAPIKVSANTFANGTAKLWLYAPGATTAIDRCDLSGTSQTCSFTPNATGAWKIRLDPQEGAIGEATLTRLT